ncbi:MAG: putative hydroxymethylpyrimidine transport system substrate-binding protein [Solirubrobacteraceae bacterium]|jgi:putative hydroxymethylpyrimidine transport system substrate-binding protein|nr:putative hydroxymethylpyrimidine transport system substrate-binding protein [Solirubrobacteraceae bacterium]
MKRISALVVALVALAALAGCGEMHDPTAPAKTLPLNLMLDYFPNADHVGIYQALSEGDFTRAGLAVHVQTPSDPSAPLKDLLSHRADVAVSYEPELMLARNQGEPLAAFAAIIQEPLTSIVSVGSQHITSVANLRGHTVGYAGIPYQRAYLDTILTRAGVPISSVKLVDVGENLVPAMLSGQVAATIGSYWNYEAIQLAEKGKRPNVIRVGDVGVPNYDELVLVATKATLATKANEIRDFVQAVARGYESARRDPRAAVANLVRMNPGLDPKFQLASVKATLPAFFPSSANRPWGYQDQPQWNSFGQWMLTNHLISNVAAIANASTNEYLAGQGLG